MKRPTVLLLVVAVVFVMIPIVASAGEPPDKALLGKWHRFDIAVPDNPSHEVRTFHRQGDEWVDLYRHQHDPKLGSPTPHDPQLGDFRGHEVEDVDCGLPDCPEGIVFAVEGLSTFAKQTEEPFLMPMVMAATESGVLWWIADFLWESPFGPMRVFFQCPWYRDFDAALAANPDVEEDCRWFDDYGPDGTVDDFYLPDERNCGDLFDNDGDGDVDGADDDCT